MQSVAEPASQPKSASPLESMTNGRDWALASGLFFLACLWRVPWLLAGFAPGTDEIRSIQTALAMGSTPDWVPYLLGRDYMGTVQELALAATYACFGYNGFLSRLCMLILFGCSTVLFYFGFRTFMSLTSSFVGVALIALAASSQLYFTVPSTPDYNFSYLLTAALPLAAYCVAERPNDFFRQMLFACLGGLAIYTYALLAVNLLVCVVWIWSRTPQLGEFRSSFDTSFQAHRSRWLLLQASSFQAVSLSHFHSTWSFRAS